MSKKSFIDSVEVKSPCREEWNEMTGNDRVRFCSHCSKNVNNLSIMTRKEAMRFVRASDGNICIRYIPHPVTRRPVFAEQLLQITRRSPGLTAGVMTASIALSTHTFGQERSPTPVGTPIVAEKLEKVDADAAACPDKQVSRRLSGTIVDPHKAVIPAAKITIFSVNAETMRSTLTDENGDYRFDGLQPGTYRMEIESPGFMKGVRQLVISDRDEDVGDTALDLGFELTVDVVADVSLEVGAVGGVIVSADYSTPLARAVYHEDIDEVRDLLIKGANPNGKEKEYDKITPLFIAVEDGSLEIAELLLNFGAKVNARDGSKQTPLMRLDDDATPDLVDLLIRHGAKIDHSDKEGNTALIVATRNGADVEVVKSLIENGAVVRSSNKAGRTPLMEAAERDDIEIVKLLLESGSDVNARDKDGDSAWDLASDDEIEELLELHGAIPRHRDDETEPAEDDPPRL